MPINKHVRRLDAIQSRAQRDLASEASLKGSKAIEPVEYLHRVCGRAIGSSKNLSSSFLGAVPVVYDIGARDHRLIMDVAIYRLCKREDRSNTVIRYELPDGCVEVSSGTHGMASVWDYDIVLMAISFLTEGMNQHRAGKAPKPGQTVILPAQLVLKFCCKKNGGHQKSWILGALRRLSTTHVMIERPRSAGEKPMLITEGESLINRFKVITDLRTEKIEYVEVKVPDWMYHEITERPQPDVLAMNPEYFFIKGGVGRFVYRLARRSAGKGVAFWNFGTLYARSGSKGPRGEFNRLVRELVQANNLPDYELIEEQGKTDAVLHMVPRTQAGKRKARTE